MMLSTGMANSDVGRLHGHLVTVGYEIAQSEIHIQAFGPTTHDAVMDFQKRQGLGSSGVYDRPTDDAMKCALCKNWRR